MVLAGESLAWALGDRTLPDGATLVRRWSFARLSALTGAAGRVGERHQVGDLGFEGLCLFGCQSLEGLRERALPLLASVVRESMDSHPLILSFVDHEGCTPCAGVQSTCHFTAVPAAREDDVGRNAHVRKSRWFGHLFPPIRLVDSSERTKFCISKPPVRSSKRAVP